MSGAAGSTTQVNTVPRWKGHSQLTFPVYINTIQVMLCHKRDDVRNKRVLITWPDRIAENVIRRRFGGEAPAAERQDLLEARQLLEQLPLDLDGADVDGVARGDVAECQMDMRVVGQVHGGDLHVQAGAVEVVAFEVADADVLGRGGADDDAGSAVGDAAVLARG